MFVSDGLSFLVFSRNLKFGRNEFIYGPDRIGNFESVEGLVTGDEITGEEFYSMPLNFALMLSRLKVSEAYIQPY